MAPEVRGPPASIVPLPAESSALSAPTFGVFLGPVRFRLARFSIGAFHLVCAGYFIAAGVVYWALPTTRVAKMLQFFSLTLDKTYFHRIAIVHFLFAAVHVHILASAAVMAIVKRLGSRRFDRHAASLKRQLTALHRQSSTLHPVFAKASRIVAAALATKPGKALVLVYTVVLSPRGFFGIEGAHFETLFLCREVSETLLQAQQAYTMSRLLPRAQLNRFYVAILGLGWLPDDLHERWPAHLALFIEYGQLTEFPMVLVAMEPQMLSLCGNQLTQLPPEALTLRSAYLVAFTGNPIRKLPEADMWPHGVNAMYVFVDSTQVRGPLPAWVSEAFVAHSTLYLGGSPFCERVVLNETSSERAQLAASEPWLLGSGVDCEVQAEQSFYPLGSTCARASCRPNLVQVTQSTTIR